MDLNLCDKNIPFNWFNWLKALVSSDYSHAHYPPSYSPPTAQYLSLNTQTTLSPPFQNSTVDTRPIFSFSTSSSDAISTGSLLVTIIFATWFVISAFSFIGAWICRIIFLCIKVRLWRCGRAICGIGCLGWIIRCPRFILPSRFLIRPLLRFLSRFLSNFLVAFKDPSQSFHSFPKTPHFAQKSISKSFGFESFHERTSLCYCTESNVRWFNDCKIMKVMVLDWMSG